MSKISKRENFRVEVFPRRPGNFGSFSIGGISREESETERLCEDIARDIKRHVDDLDSVCVRWDDAHECGYCGSVWTESHDRHNGGCCSLDCDVYDAEAAIEAKTT